MIKFGFFFLLILGCMGGAAGQLEAADPSSFSEGVVLFKQGDFAGAHVLFKKALASGMDSPALHYNLGVCLYRMGRLSEANEEFSRVQQSPAYSSLALYNQGLIAVKQNKAELARQIFLEVSSSAVDSKLQEFATAALMKLEYEETTASIWVNMASLGIGYDGNVNLASSSDGFEPSEEDDTFAEIIAFLQGPVARSSSGSVYRFTASTYFQKYFDLEQYDSAAFLLGLSRNDNLAKWQLETGADYSYTLLDGEGLEQVPTLSVNAKRELGKALDFFLKYRLSYLDALDDEFDYLNGWRQRYQAEARMKWALVRTKVGLSMELNDRDNDDYSPTRYSWIASATLTPLDELDLHLGFDYRNSDYTITGSDDRQEDRFRTLARLSYLLPNDLQLSGEYQYTDNDSNYESYDYTREMVLVNVSMGF